MKTESTGEKISVGDNGMHVTEVSQQTGQRILEIRDVLQ
jgi:hypothetical protein